MCGMGIAWEWERGNGGHEFGGCEENEFYDTNSKLNTWYIKNIYLIFNKFIILCLIQMYKKMYKYTYMSRVTSFCLKRCEFTLKVIIITLMI
jgi:hypothetical protein